MKSKGIIAGLFLAVALGVSAQAEFVAPSHSGGKYFADPSFVGVSVGIIDRTIAPAQIDSNDAGLLYGICRQGVSTDDYALAWDYYTALVPLSEYIGLDSAKGEHLANLDQIISPYVFTNVVDSTATDYIKRSADDACWVPKWPVQYSDGLIGIQNSAAGYSLFFYRSDAGTNP